MDSAAALLCVHAHPDDEALFGAGATSRYAEEGRRCVLVTCTDGQLGLDDAGRPGSHPAHDPASARATRAGELQRAARQVGYDRVVTLGYDDSGMAGWAQNDAPGAFARADVEAVARVLAALIDEVGASVVVTYDDEGFYEHPDHLMANAATRRAVALSHRAQRLYYPVVPRGVLARFVAEAEARGVDLPQWVTLGRGVDDESVATTLDAAAYASRTRRAISLHASQRDNADLVTMDDDLFATLFGVEYYQRAWSRHPVSGDATDLFGGLP